MDCSIDDMVDADSVLEQSFSIDRDADPEIFTVKLRCRKSGLTCPAAMGIEYSVQASDEDLCDAWNAAVFAAGLASNAIDDAYCP